MAGNAVEDTTRIPAVPERVIRVNPGRSHWIHCRLKRIPKGNGHSTELRDVRAFNRKEMNGGLVRVQHPLCRRGPVPCRVMGENACWQGLRRGQWMPLKLPRGLHPETASANFGGSAPENHWMVSS